MNIDSIIKAYSSFFPNEKERLSYLTNHMQKQSIKNITNRKNFIGHITASGFLINPSGKILLIHHNSLNRWLQPGGHYEDDNNFWETAAREISEETGITQIELHPWHHAKEIPIDIDTHSIPFNIKKSEPKHYHYDFRYIFLVKNEKINIELQISEVNNSKWFSIEEIENTFPSLPGEKLRKLLNKKI